MLFIIPLASMKHLVSHKKKKKKNFVSTKKELCFYKLMNYV